VLRDVLTTKFDPPQYDGKDINRYLKPYLGMRVDTIPTDKQVEEREIEQEELKKLSDF
jgi:hypothetical protein